MGAWGVGTFENDTAMDFVGGLLAEEAPSRVRLKIDDALELPLSAAQVHLDGGVVDVAHAAIALLLLAEHPELDPGEDLSPGSPMGNLLALPAMELTDERQELATAVLERTLRPELNEWHDRWEDAELLIEAEAPVHLMWNLLAGEGKAAPDRHLDPILHLSLPVSDLVAARDFYLDVLGCRLGRVRDGWLDVWFFGMQLTLQEHPDQVLAPEQVGVRHFGATVSARALRELLARAAAADVDWAEPRHVDFAGTPQEQTKAKLRDPSGNVIELKSYADPTVALEQLERPPERPEPRPERRPRRR